ncbi:hypothetical protein FEM48_Zijuj01G0177100 [Ziziphus jujuba var. spinosa]|uniref:GH18 domain-containing protein n=1 Tax=Ziziphus jujuba var. spinosa TaxID=714518 RepID=A0A978W2N3_ZIZJJ|nr:hypothetical protein FEM48_Zijuj01G0177100 [Ziziphus jujuba var. spinosa]
MADLGTLFKEWRAAVNSGARNSDSSQAELILTAVVQYSPDVDDDASFPLDSIRNNLNSIHIMAYDYCMLQWANFTGAPAALNDPSSESSTDYGIEAWIKNSIGAPAKGPAIPDDGSRSYKEIKGYIGRYNAQVVYNAAYIVKYFTVGSTWIGFDDAQIVKIKVDCARENKLLGYFVWQVPYDDENCVLSLAGKESIKVAAAGDFDNNAQNLQIFSLAEIEAATDRFSVENKLGEGGYGPVFKKGLYSTKSDVYSFGVLLLQIISGKVIASFYGSDEDLNILEYENANDRPTMLEVFSILKNESTSVGYPNKPAYFSRRNEDEERKAGNSLVNNGSIFQLIAR